MLWICCANVSALDSVKRIGRESAIVHHGRYLSDAHYFYMLLLLSLRLSYLSQLCSAYIWSAGGTIQGTSRVVHVSPSDALLLLHPSRVYDVLLPILDLIEILHDVHQC